MTQVLPPAVVGSLSPSRAADFKTCPLLYRFRTIDRIPEPPSLVATRGTLVHAVLEELFALPAPERTLEQARAMLPEAWERVRAEEPEVSALFGSDAGGPELAEWLEGAAGLLANYFTLEDPTRFEPESREQLVEVVIGGGSSGNEGGAAGGGLRLRGYIDRLDVSAAGDLRVVDYKTGSAPREAYEAKALFQLKFYALVLWRTRGVVPRQLKLMYLTDADTLTASFDSDELERFERTLKAIWSAISKATIAGDFRPNPGPLCNWCDHQALCPAKGGTPPPFPYDALATSTEDRRSADRP